MKCNFIRLNAYDDRNLDLEMAEVVHRMLSVGQCSLNAFTIKLSYWVTCEVPRTLQLKKKTGYYRSNDNNERVIIVSDERKRFRA